MKKIVVLLTVLVAGVSYAQQSASYSMRQSVFNQGGAPVAGATPESASYALSQLSIGESIAPSRLTGGAYVLDTGFGAFWLPPGEVMNLRFSDPETLLWDPQSVAYRYNLYRGAPTSFLCEQFAISGPTTTEGDVPAPGSGWAYLVVGMSRLLEEGSPGANSEGDERRGIACH